MADPVAQQLLDSFARMVRGDGGRVEIIDADEGCVTVGYAPGGPAPDCQTGACVLPHIELQEMMREWMSRRAPGCQVNVRLLQPDG